MQNSSTRSASMTLHAPSVRAFDRLVERMLADLPTAHQKPLTERGLSSLCMRAPVSVPTKKNTCIQFVYFSTGNDSTLHKLYHQHLINAEVLLKRVLAAHACGQRPLAPTLGYAEEARATVRPPLGMFHSGALEYRRWYDAFGALRPHPLSRESLAAMLMSVDGLSREQAKDRATHRSHALPQRDQAWLIERRKTTLNERALNADECRTLFLALDGIYESSTGTSQVETANRQIAVRVAAVLGVMLDEFTCAPFRSATLNDSFSKHHLAHLQQTIDAARRSESLAGVLLIGPAAWFAAKTTRMRAEHQLGLATSPKALTAMRLSGKPIVTVVGGRLRTFMDGWSRGRLRSSVAFAAAAGAARR